VPPKKQPAQVETPRRGHPAMKFNQELADAFGIIPGQDPPRETVSVASLPDPPEAIIPGGPAPERDTPLNIDEAIANIFRDEADEIGVRLARFGVPFSAGQKQEMVDHGMALLTGLVGGGAIGRRR
jgi:hypothetical protein